jgi:chemotaxis protein CheD
MIAMQTLGAPTISAPRTFESGPRPTQTVGISEMIVSTNPADVLVTYSLGSCVGLTLYDPVVKVGGMIHCMLPLSKIDETKAAKAPAMFVDTGVTTLIQEMFNHGADRGRIQARVAGGGSPMDEKGMFKIGERNYQVLRKVLWKNSILIQAEDCGGTAARTVYLYLESGRVVIRSNGACKDL